MAMTTGCGAFNGDRIVTGKCGKCGGVVSMPRIYHGVNRVPESCERCGATVDETAGLPTKKMA